MLSSAAVDSNNLQQGGWGPCLSVSKQALHQAGFHFFLQSTSSLHHHFCYHGTPDFLDVVFLVGWVRGSGEQALVKCKDSSTWQRLSDLTRENNLYMLPTMVSTVVCLSNAKGPQHHMSIKGESWESRIPGTQGYWQALFWKLTVFTLIEHRCCTCACQQQLVSGRLPFRFYNCICLPFIAN